MAKQPIEIRDRFRITAEVESQELGPLLAQLARIGLQNIGYELITDVVRFNKNGPLIVHETTGDECAREWLVEHPTFRAIDLVRHFTDSGRSAGSAYSTIKSLGAAGEIVKTSPGHYRRADVKAIAPPAAAEGPRKRRGQVPKYDIPNLDLIMKFLRPRKRVTVQDVCAFLESQGRNKKSASPIVSKLAAAKVLKHIEPGVYEVVKGASLGDGPKMKDRLRKQTERAAAKAAKNAANLNGAEAHGS
jgi:hypothetical protein